METLDHSILVSGAISFNLPPYTEREKPSEYCTLLLPTARIEPRTPGQQASALSITLLPLGMAKWHGGFTAFGFWIWTHNRKVCCCHRKLYHVGTVISRQRKSGVVDRVLLSDRPDFFPLGFRFRDRPCEVLRGRGFEFPRKFRVKQDPALQRSLER